MWCGNVGYVLQKWGDVHVSVAEMGGGGEGEYVLQKWGVQLYKL